MANTHGKGTFVSLNGSNLSTYSNNHEFNRSGDSHDVTTFGMNAHAYGGGLTDGTSSLEGIYDNTASVGPRPVIEPLIGTVVTLIRRPEGTGSGLPQDSVSVLVTGFTETSPVNDYVKWKCDLQLSGDVNSTPQ